MSDEAIPILWTRSMLERFKKAHAQAVAAKADTFAFDGNDYVVGYAKYLIQYLETKL